MIAITPGHIAGLSILTIIAVLIIALFGFGVVRLAKHDKTPAEFIHVDEVTDDTSYYDSLAPEQEHYDNNDPLTLQETRGPDAIYMASDYVAWLEGQLREWSLEWRLERIDYMNNARLAMMSYASA